MAPIAGTKPPFATDEPDSFYDSSPARQPRLRQPSPEDPNKRTSAYDVYDNYLKDDKDKLSVPPAASVNRNSGIGNLLLSMGDDSDSDDEEDEDVRRKPTNAAGISPGSKNATLAAAVTPAKPAPAPPAPKPQQQQGQAPSQTRQAPPPPPQQQKQQTRGPAPPPPNQPQQRPMQPPQGPPPPSQRQMPSPGPPPSPGAPPQPIAAPRPGYAAPIAALNLARPQPALGSGAPSPTSPGGRLQNPFEPPFAQIIPRGSPAPSVHSSTPHPLPPPIAPIQPVFIRPKPTSPGPANVKFDESAGVTPRKPIMRGNSEETLLPSRGEKGDDFWRRFSIVAKEESKKPYALKESSWLRKTRSGSNRLSRWVWVISVFLLLLIAGGIGVGLYFSSHSPGHQQPTAIGGSADNLASSVPVVSSAKKTASGSAKGTASSILHVSPTNTVARRDGESVFPTPVPTVAAAVRRHVGHNAKNRRDAW